MLNASLRIALATVAALSLSASAQAQGQGQGQDEYPNRVVRIVNPYVAGSTTDILARGLAVGLSNRLRQQFFVENRAGAGGTLGTASVARAETCLLYTSPSPRDGLLSRMPSSA